MTSFLEPSGPVLAFIILRSFVFLPVLLVLGALRAGLSRGPARLLGAVAALVALTGLAAQFAPPLLGLYSGELYRTAWALTHAAGGMVLMFAASLPLAASAVATGARGRWIDIAHSLLLGLLVALWALAR